MAKRPRMTLNEVLDQWDDDGDDEFDNHNEPMMEGSNDEFSDVEDVGSDKDAIPSENLTAQSNGELLTLIQTWTQQELMPSSSGQH